MADVQPDQFTKISNELLESFCKVRLNSYETRVFLSIVRLTYGWNRKNHPITLQEITNISNICRQNVSRAIKSLTKKNMITRNGVTGIQKDYDLWVLSNQITAGAIQPDSRSAIQPDSRSAIQPDSTLIVKERKERKERELYPPLKTFCEEFEKKYGVKYMPSFGKDIKQLKEVEAVRGVDAVINMIRSFFRSDDPFLRGKTLSVGLFYCKRNDLSSVVKPEPQAAF